MKALLEICAAGEMRPGDLVRSVFGDLLLVVSMQRFGDRCIEVCFLSCDGDDEGLMVWRVHDTATFQEICRHDDDSNRD